MKMIDFPEFRQTSEYDCGAMALASVLAYYGIDAPESNIIKIAKTVPRRGTPVAGFQKVADKFRLKCSVENMDIRRLKNFIDRSIPVTLRLQAWSGKETDWKNCWSAGHYVVAIGYDKNHVYFEDPLSIFRTFLTFNELEKRWHDRDLINGDVYKNLGIVVTGKRPTKRKVIHMN